MSRKQIARQTFLLVAVLLYAGNGNICLANESGSIKALVEKYHVAEDENTRKEAAKALGVAEPKTKEDVNELRKVFSLKKWDELLYSAGMQAIKKMSDAALNLPLIDILKDEKPFIQKASRQDHAGKSEKEAMYRIRNVELIIRKLGDMKNQNAVPVLKEYLAIQGAALWASEALAKIGDRSASEEIREKAYRGEEIDYAGLGSDESSKIIRDLEDKSQKDKWPKIAKQLLKVKGREAKRQLPRLFNHEARFVRQQAAMAFANRVEISDVPEIIAMSKNQDWSVRTFAIDGMKRLKDTHFDEILFDILLNDPERSPRSTAARALGYKNVVKGIPYLEKALKDKDLRVRQEAFIALYYFTGRQYEFEGRDRSIEVSAEQEKRGVRFYP